MGAAPKTRSCFSGGTGTGEPEPEGCESKAEASQAPGAAKAPKQCRDNEQDRKRDRTDPTLLVAAAEGNAVIQNPRDTRAPFWKSKMGQSGNSMHVEITLKHTRILTDCAVLPSACAKETQPRSQGSKDDNRNLTRVRICKAVEELKRPPQDVYDFRRR